MTGRRPKPTAMKELAGNPGKRRLNRQEPKFSHALKRPSWLTAVAKREWNRVVAELKALDMLRTVDAAALASYCQSYARYVSAEQQIESEGQTIQEPITNKIGDIVGYRTKRHPATIIAKDAQAALLRAASLFGFSPADRTRLTLPERSDAPQSAFEQFMGDFNGEEPSQ